MIFKLGCDQARSLTCDPRSAEGRLVTFRQALARQDRGPRSEGGRFTCEHCEKGFLVMDNVPIIENNWLAAKRKARFAQSLRKSGLSYDNEKGITYRSAETPRLVCHDRSRSR
jgi:hypothetical protein